MKYLTKEYSTINDLRSHYRELSKKLHPDKNGNGLEFSVLNNEYNSLKLDVRKSKKRVSKSSEITVFGSFDNVPIEDLKKIKTKSYRMRSEWKKFIGDLPYEYLVNGTWQPVVFHIFIWGASFSGKSVGSLHLAQEFSRLGDVLYVNAEENLGKGTLELKVKFFKIKSRGNKFIFSNKTDLSEIDKDIESGNYKFVFRDSVHDLANKNNMKVEELIHDQMKKHPNVCFIDISYTLKDGKDFKGKSDIRHMYDATFKAEKRIHNDRVYMALSWNAPDKNRFASKRANQRIVYHQGKNY